MIMTLLAEFVQLILFSSKNGFQQCEDRGKIYFVDSQNRNRLIQKSPGGKLKIHLGFIV